MEEISNRYYDGDKKVLNFLEELCDYFVPAILNIEILLDSWGQTGLNPKYELHHLPHTVEKYMVTLNDHTQTIQRLAEVQCSLIDFLDTCDNFSIKEPSTAIVTYSSKNKIDEKGK
jgi:hypothetical protein